MDLVMMDRSLKKKRETDTAAAEIVANLTGPDPRIRELLPKALKDAMYGRKSTQISKAKQYFLKYTDRWTRYPTDELVIELPQINRFIQLHLLGYTKRNNRTDAGPLILYHAEVPEMMLEVIKCSFDPEFSLTDQNRSTLPFLAIECLITFMYKESPMFTLLPEKLFRDLSMEVLDLVDIVRGKMTWIESFASVRLFGLASFNSNCCHWLNMHSSALELLCEHMYRAPEIVEEKIKSGEIRKHTEHISSLIMMFRTSNDLVQSARLMGTLTANIAVFVFHNVLKWSMSNYEVYLANTHAIKKANVLGCFMRITKQLMIWIEPGQFLNYFLTGIRNCMDMMDAPHVLFLKNLTQFREQKIPKGVESLKYWSHASIVPSTLGWFACHALCLNNALGTGWCISTLTYVLTHARESVSVGIIDTIGAELMDLAHLVEVEVPSKIPVQSIILQALLRHAGFSHKIYDLNDSFKDSLKPLRLVPEFCMEAALFSRRATLEEKMILGEKQKRVSQADAKKDQGNLAFKAGKYKDAIGLYTEALAICPLSAHTKQALYYSNRAECYVRTNEPMKAIHDCNRSLCLDKSSMVKVQWRRSRAYQRLNIAYPAWLDMKCIEQEWRLTREQSNVDFQQLLSELGEEVGILEKDLFNEVDRQIWKDY